MEIFTSSCPNCGAPVAQGSSECGSCLSKFVLVPEFDNSDRSAEQDMSRLLLKEKNIDGFFIRFNAALNEDPEIGYNYEKTDFLSGNRAAALSYHERVLAWAESHRSEIDKIEQELADSLPMTGVIEALKSRLKDNRKQAAVSLAAGWAGYFKDHLDRFPGGQRNQLLEAFEMYLNSDNKDISGEQQPGRLTPADKLIQLLCVPEIRFTAVALRNENIEQGQRKVDTKAKKTGTRQKLFKRLFGN